MHDNLIIHRSQQICGIYSTFILRWTTVYDAVTTLNSGGSRNRQTRGADVSQKEQAYTPQPASYALEGSGLLLETIWISKVSYDAFTSVFRRTYGRFFCFWALNREARAGCAPIWIQPLLIQRWRFCWATHTQKYPRKHRPLVGSMLVHRFRRCPNVNPAFD